MLIMQLLQLLSKSRLMIKAIIPIHTLKLFAIYLLPTKYFSLLLPTAYCNCLLFIFIAVFSSFQSANLTNCTLLTNDLS